jgi:formamidopyrimidine-DNA glycosylase
MPELPDIVIYLDNLESRIVGRRLEAVRLGSPFVLRSVTPPLSSVVNRSVIGLRRIGKRIVFGLEGELFVIVHLMIAGRLRWRDRGAVLQRKRGLVAFDFDSGTLLLTEEGSKKRASLHLAEGEADLSQHDPGGLEPLDVDLDGFGNGLRRERHTLKRTLTDPRLFSGIGNAYSDEILHRAKLSPFQLTDRLTDHEVERLFVATRDVLTEWIARLRGQSEGRFPEKVTAFRGEMAVHGQYGKPCPECGSAVQRIVYSQNEANYCPGCQTGGRLLADRALSRLLKNDWPKTLDELEQLKKDRRA